MNDLYDDVEEEGVVEEPVATVETVETTEDLEAMPEATVEEEATPTVETAEDELSAEDRAFKAKALDEVHKRQQIEAERDLLRQQLEQVQQPQQEKPDFWENPEQVLGSFEQKLAAQMRQNQTDMSVSLMKTIKPDYDEKEQVFVNLAQQNPMLIAEMNKSVNPAEFAYNYAEKHIQMQEFQNPDAYKEKLRAEIRAEMEAENKAKIEQAITARSELPSTLSTNRAAGGNTQPVQAPQTAEDLYG